MANTFSPIVDTIFARALAVLRAKHIAPKAFGMTYKPETADQGDTVKIPVLGGGQNVRDVVVGFPSAGRALSATTKDLKLDRYKETEPLLITDKEMREIANPESAMNAVIAGEVSAMARHVSADVYTYVKNAAYHTVGVAGTTPFGNRSDTGNPGGLVEATTAMALLEEAEVPDDRKVIVLSPLAMGQASNQPGLMDANRRGDGQGTLRSGRVGSALGMDWYLDQQIPTQTAGSGTINTNGGAAVNPKGATDSCRGRQRHGACR